MTRLPVYCTLALGDVLNLDEALCHYLRNVLRVRAGVRVILFNGDGYDYFADVTTVSKKAICVEIVTVKKNTVESALDITLLQAIAKGERMDFVMQKATELGVTRIIPVVTEHCAVKLTDRFRQKKPQHWQQIANFAAAQSGRAMLPVIDGVFSLSGALKKIQGWAQGDDDQRWVLSPNGASLRASATKTSVLKQVCVLVGPEGGLSAQDLALSHEHNFQDVRLGARVLRTETAALTALATLQTLWGDF